MNKQNNEPKKQNNEIIPQNVNEIESLNDSEELDSESLEEIAGGGWGCGCKRQHKVTISPSNSDQ